MQSTQCSYRSYPPSMFSRRSSRSIATDVSSISTKSSASSVSSLGSFWPGIGSLTGKAINAFGEATLRTAERSVIRHRLEAISRGIEHGNDDFDDEADRIYDDLIELIRPEYKEKVRRKALRHLMALIRRGRHPNVIRALARAKMLPMELNLFVHELGLTMAQVSIQETRDVIQSLDKFPPVQISLFVSEFMTATYRSWGRIPRPINFCLRDGWSGHSLPFLDFVCELALWKQSGSTYYTLVTEHFLLDMILCVCIREEDDCVSSTLGRCNRVLENCISYIPTYRDLIAQHTLARLWPQRIPFFLRQPSPTGPIPNLSRDMAWRGLVQESPEFIQRRLSGIKWILDVDYQWDRSSQLMDMCVDLLEFADEFHDSYHIDIVKKAKDLLVQFLDGGDENRMIYSVCQAAMMGTSADF